MLKLTDPQYLDQLLSEHVSPETYLEWLTKGLGRAALYLQRHDPAPYIGVIEYACLSTLVYDQQMEGNRARYLQPIIDLTGKWPHFAELILKKYVEDKKNDDSEALTPLI